MSHRLEKRAWAAELPMIDKFVLIYLARVVKQHDGSNLYASMNGIAKAIGACPRAVQNAMYRLAAAGYLEITVKANRPGGKRSNEYRLIIDRLPVVDEPTHEMRGSDNVIHLEPTHDMRGTHAPDARNLDSISKEEEGGTRAPACEGFDEFWEAYPRKVAVGDAEAAFADASRIASQAEIMHGLARYCADRAGKEDRYTATPANWLKGRRWADEIKAPSEEFSHGKPHHAQQSAGSSSVAFFAAGVRASLGCLD